LITSAIGGGISFQGAQMSPSLSPGADKVSNDHGFESILKSFATGTVDALRSGESAAIAAIEGKASTQQAVMATMQAEQSLQAALAIRDKIVSAFLEISRMQI
jgi:flagellar hook-basal body complex protein FliE